MANLTLHYAEDPTTGLPKLEDSSGRVASTDLDALAGEVNRCFQHLVAGTDGDFWTRAEAVAPNLPRQFRVTVTDRERRCPTLLLEAVETAVSPQTNGSVAPSWHAQFLAEIAELAANGKGDGTDYSPMAFVLGDLRALYRKDPRALTLLLLAGYLYVGDLLSLRHGQPEDNHYARAARALVELAGASLPEEVLSPLLAAMGESETVAAGQAGEAPGWLRRFFALS